MLVSEIIQSSVPVLHFADTAEDAITLLQNNSLQHLAVVENDNYEGLLSMDELLSADETDTLETLSAKLIHVSISDDQHLLTALRFISEYNVTALPVLSANKEYLGVVTETILLQSLAVFLNVEMPVGIFVLEMPNEKFSIGEICRVVETNDAFVTQVNSYTDHVTGMLMVTFRINKTDVSDVLATLQRYEYNVKYYFGEEHYQNKIKENFENLMAYLNV
jgi:acetoin utilization protein AcuB